MEVLLSRDVNRPAQQIRPKIRDIQNSRLDDVGDVVRHWNSISPIRRVPPRDVHYTVRRADTEYSTRKIEVQQSLRVAESVRCTLTCRPQCLANSTCANPFDAVLSSVAVANNQVRVEGHDHVHVRTSTHSRVGSRNWRKLPEIYIGSRPI